jgi:predicted nucleic acid-binding protein
MKYLLDVNVLVALCVEQHVFRKRVAEWMKSASEQAIFMTCAVTEIGALRILVQAPAYDFTVDQGKELLARMQSSKIFRFEFVAEDVGIAELPSWVRGAKQIMDGHLINIASTAKAVLATLDEGIRGGYLIPEN